MTGYNILSEIEVESFFTVSEQTGLFLLSVLLGGVFGIIYDVFRAARVIFPFMKKTLPTAVCDFIFMLICGTGIYLFSLLAARGEVRAYYAAGSFAGFAIYYFTVGNFIMYIIRGIFGFVYGLMGRLLGCVKKCSQITHKK